MVAGCSSPGDDAAAGDEDDLTSLTARQRILTFDGVVYVAPTPAKPTSSTRPASRPRQRSARSSPRRSPYARARSRLFFFDSCVSFNYHENDFFTLKAGGSKVLDLITNGIEAPEYKSGEMQGNLIGRLLDGSLPSYQTLLGSASATDSLRVVDGELDNAYHPSRVKVRVTAP